MEWDWDGSHMTWDDAMCCNSEARLPTIEEALTLDINELVWTCEELEDHPTYVAWAVNPATGLVRKKDKSNMLAQVDIWQA